MGASTGTPLRVVLIEDSPILRDMLRELLGELEGVQVVADADDEAGAGEVDELPEVLHGFDVEGLHSLVVTGRGVSLLDDDDMPPVLPGQLDPAMQRTARLASLDPNDGIDL